jgi:hypothetical protein
MFVIQIEYSIVFVYLLELGRGGVRLPGNVQQQLIVQIIEGCGRRLPK